MIVKKTKVMVTRSDVLDGGSGALSKGVTTKGCRHRDLSHCATPDFLSRLVALASFIRLSSLKAAQPDVDEGLVAGNPGPLQIFVWARPFSVAAQSNDNLVTFL
jgi:hypothetical protein